MQELRTAFSVLTIGIISVVLVFSHTGTDLSVVWPSILLVWAAIIGGLAILGTILSLLIRIVARDVHDELRGPGSEV